MKAVREGGEDVLHARLRKGAEPKLTPEELESLPELLAQGATEYGILEEIWTCERVTQIIEGTALLERRQNSKKWGFFAKSRPPYKLFCW